MAIRATIKERGIMVVLRQARELDQQVLDGAAKGLARALEYTVSVSQRQFLSGPRPLRLDVRTTRLRQSITKKVRIVPGRGVIGEQGSNVRYAAFHEFGFHGSVNVRAHTRVIRQVNARGQLIDTRREFRDASGNFIGFRESRKRAAGRQRSGFVAVQNVRQHQRTIDYAGRPFVGPALKKSRVLILREVGKGIAEATGGTQTA